MEIFKFRKGVPWEINRRFKTTRIKYEGKRQDIIVHKKPVNMGDIPVVFAIKAGQQAGHEEKEGIWYIKLDKRSVKNK